MNVIKAILDKYGIKDPVADVENTIGKYNDENFEKLYKDLVNKGLKNVVEALRVGAIIEDLDIKDLEEELKVVDNQDIKFAFSNLIRGSENHMRAFNRLLNRYGEKYEPKYISKDRFNEILSSNNRRGWFGKGRNRGRCKGRKF